MFDNLKFTIMHSRIFQISTEPIDKENYLNEDTLQQGDGSFYDYCSEIDEEDRRGYCQFGQSCLAQRNVRAYIR